MDMVEAGRWLKSNYCVSVEQIGKLLVVCSHWAFIYAKRLERKRDTNNLKRARPFRIAKDCVRVCKWVCVCVSQMVTLYVA